MQVGEACYLLDIAFEGFEINGSGLVQIPHDSSGLTMDQWRWVWSAVAAMNPQPNGSCRIWRWQVACELHLGDSGYSFRHLGSVHLCAASLLCDHEEDAHTHKMHVPDKFCAVTAQGGSQGSWLHDC